MIVPIQCYNNYLLLKKLTNFIFILLRKNKYNYYSNITYQQYFRLNRKKHVLILNEIL